MKIVVYGKGSCSYCDKVKAFLSEKDIAHSYVDIKGDSQESIDGLKLVTQTLGLKSVPQVTIGDELIGGFEDTVVYFNKPKPTNREMALMPDIQTAMSKAIGQIQGLCHGLAVEGGWWDRKGDALAAHNLLLTGTVTDETTLAILVSVANQERNPLELIALMHSELSEGLEGVRKDQMDDKLTHRKMIEVELADAIVRILDYAGGFNLDVGGALVEKLVFNITRPDHQAANRLADGGKKY